jgi:hypothetical protein
MNITNNPARPIGSRREIGIPFLCVLFSQVYGRVFNNSVKNEKTKHRKTDASARIGIS